jgi:hypothetical protein
MPPAARLERKPLPAPTGAASFLSLEILRDVFGAYVFVATLVRAD